MASLTQRTWVWVDSGSWWWTGRPGMLRFMGSQSQTWLSDWNELNWSCFSYWLFVTLWTIACQAPPSMGFSRQEYWSGLPALLQGIFLTQGSNPCLLRLLHRQSDSLSLASPGKHGKLFQIFQLGVGDGGHGGGNQDSIPGLFHPKTIPSWWIPVLKNLWGGLNI